MLPTQPSTQQAQRAAWLDLILRNRNYYQSFLELAARRGMDESVRFLHQLRSIPWSGNGAIGQAFHEGVYSTYIRDGALYQVNLIFGTVQAIETAIGEQQTPDWDRASREIEDLLVTQLAPNLIDDWLAQRAAAP